MATRVKFTDKMQGDLAQMQALADSALDNAHDLVAKLLFASDYRIDGATVVVDSPASGVVKIDPGVFVRAGGKFYAMGSSATANILTGSENQAGNIWGTGQAAHATLPRKDIIVVTYQETDSDPLVKNFIDDTVTPHVQYTQSVNTRRSPKPLFSILHGTPSATPSEPAVPSGFMRLATVDVPPAATTITSGDITNNLNINIKTLEKLQLASQANSAFSDLLHSDGVYDGVLSELAVAETSPATMGVQVGTGTALKDGVTANVTAQTTVPVNAASFVNKPGESVSFASGDTQTLQVDGTPPHRIRSGTVVVTGKTEGADYTVNYTAGTITRLGSGSIPPGGSITVTYDYFLPRIDAVETLMANSTPQVIAGTPAHSPVAPATSPNALLLAHVSVGEGVTTIVNANVTDKRVFLPDMDEVVAARGSFPSVDARLDDHEADIGQNASDISSHTGSNITPANTVHGIRQGPGNGLDADLVDGQHAAALLARANHTGTQAPGTISPQGSASGLDADTVDGLHAAATPQANKLLALDGSAQFPSSVLPASNVGNALESGLTVKTNATTPDSKVDVSASKLSVQDVVLTNISLTADITVAGANGLDAGSELANTWYAVFVITNNDGSLTASLLSTSSSVPTLPAGFTRFRRVGWVRNNGASNFIKFLRIGERVYYDDATALSFVVSASGTFSFQSAMPPTSLVGMFNYYIAGGTGTFGVRVKPSGSLMPNYFAVLYSHDSGGEANANTQDTRTSSAQAVDFTLVGGSPTVTVLGYADPV